jgi:hypothetical protein
MPGRKAPSKRALRFDRLSLRAYKLLRHGRYLEVDGTV